MHKIDPARIYNEASSKIAVHTVESNELLRLTEE